MPDLPQRPSLEHLRKQAKARKRDRSIPLSQAQRELAREYGFAGWPRLVQHVQAIELEGIERALVLADAPALAALLDADPAAATAPVDGLPPLNAFLRRSTGPRGDVRACAALLLDAGADPDSHTVEWGGEGRMTALYDAVERGDLALVQLLLDAGADVSLAWDRWDIGRRPLGLAARSGHLGAYELLRARGAVAHLDHVDEAVLAVARGESVALPKAPPPALGIPRTNDYGWILGQFALLGRTDVVAALLDSGMAVDTRGWSNFTPLDQAAMNGRTDTVQLLIERGADLEDCAFDDEGPTPLDCAIWGLHNNRAADGDYRGTVAALLAAGAPGRHTAPTADAAVDELLVRYER